MTTFASSTLSNSPTIALPGSTISLASFSHEFHTTLERIIRTTAKEDRIATFDFDNTLTTGDFGGAAYLYFLTHGIIHTEKLPHDMLEVCGVAIEQGMCLIEFCDSYFDKIGRTANRFHATEQLYRWMAKTQFDITPDQVVRGAEHALKEQSASTRLRIRPAMFELMQKLQREDFDIWIISASNPCVVRYAVSQLLNPKLIQMGSKPVKMQNIIGMGLTLYNSMGEEVEDRELVMLDNDYANLVPERLQSYIFSSNLAEPASTFDGKRLACERYLPASPLLAAGDSINDTALLSTAKMKLWVNRPGKEGERALVKDLLGNDPLFFAENL